MKTYNNLFSKICTKENFYKAYKNAIKGKSHYSDVKVIKRIGPRKYLNNLLKEVIDKKYIVSKYYIFKKVSGNKVREIYRLPMKDRIIQHAIMIYLEPIFRETFILDTYSSIKTRGIHLGLKRVKQCLRKYNYKYCLKMDIHKCYPSLDKEILKEKLSKKFKDSDLLWLLFTIIDSCDKGVPIGNYTSQYFNNFYFNDFDHWIKEIKGIKGYFRYCDDIVILSDSKEELRKLLDEIKIKMCDLHVKLKDNWQIFPIEVRGIDFLGYVIRKDYIKIRKLTKHNFITKVNNMDLNNLTKHDINVLGSYWGIFGHANCRNLWFKYMNVKTFKELNIKVHKRDFVRELIGIPLTITNSWIFQKRGIEWIKFECTFKTSDKQGNTIEFKDVLVNSSGEILVEAGKKMNQSSYPFTTTIITNEKGFYEFT